MSSISTKPSSAPTASSLMKRAEARRSSRKSEIRSTKSETNSKFKQENALFRIFGTRICFGFRHSDFGFVAQHGVRLQASGNRFDVRHFWNVLAQLLLDAVDHGHQ